MELYGDDIVAGLSIFMELGAPCMQVRQLHLAGAAEVQLKAADKHPG